MEIIFKPALPKGYKRFHCDRCGYQFIKKTLSPAFRCLKCEKGLVSLDFKGKRLDPYTEQKLYWYKYPKAWEDNIKNRGKEGAKLPDIVNWE